MTVTAPLPQESVSPLRGIITGGDSGIGRAVAVSLAGGGMNVAVTYHSDKGGADNTIAEAQGLGVQAFARRMDLTDVPTSAAVIEELADELGGVDVLVNCAGVLDPQPVMDTDFAAWRQTLAVDLDGVFCCSQRAARRMIDAGRGGRIINVTSVYENFPKVGFGPYCAAKAGAGALTQVMALELAEHAITVNSVAPGEIATPMTDQDNADPREHDRPGVPLGRPGHAHEVAAVVAFLATPAASYITGASYPVDGGMSLMGPQGASALTGNDWRRT